MRPIGGYFELELQRERNDFPHALCQTFNSGRHALEYILLQLGDRIKTLYIPYYTCDVVLEPLRRLNIGHQFYNIDENLEVYQLPSLKDGEYIIVNNYFGIKDAYINSLIPHIGKKLIVDNAQAYFASEVIGIRAFYSPRKFVGVPDGGFAWTPIDNDFEFEQDYSTNRAAFLFRRIDQGATAGYGEFRDSSHELSTEPIKRMSPLTYRLLESIDFDEIKYRRHRNFEILHSALVHTNLLDIPDSCTFACPMVYPYMTADSTLRKKLIDNQIFVATYWPNVLRWCDEQTVEHRITQQIIPLPIDQRYRDDDMERIIKIISND